MNKQRFCNLLVILVLKSQLNSIVHSCSSNNLHYITPSIFPIFPPYITFPNFDRPQIIPAEIKKSLLWPTAWGVPGYIFNQTATSADLTLLNEKASCRLRHGNQTILGTHRRIDTCKVVLRKTKAYMKIKGIEGFKTDLSHKDKLGSLILALKSKFPSHNFKYILQTFNTPFELNKFKAVWEKTESKIWVRKPPKGHSSIGVLPISHWSEIPKRKKQTIQKYLDNPWLFNNRRVELRILTLITSIKPLRIYTFPELYLFKWPTSNYSYPHQSPVRSFVKSRCGIIRDLFNCRDEDKDLGVKSFGILRDEVYQAIEQDGGSVSKILNTIYSATIQILLFWESRLPSDRMNNPKYYQYFATDWFIDENFNPILIELNHSPKFNGRGIALNFYNTLPEMFNIIGFHFPPTLSSEAVAILQRDFQTKIKCLRAYKYNSNEPVTYYNYLKKFGKNETDIIKQNHTKTIQTHNILDNLTKYEIYLLSKTEDELSRVRSAKRIFPSSNMVQYFPLINEQDIYFYKLLEAWEKQYESIRREGRDFLRGLY